MKRIYSLVALLGFVACLALTGCDQGGNETPKAPSTNAPSATVTNK